MPSSSFTINCDDCEFDRSTACEDCVVTFLLERDPDDAIVIDAEEFRAVQLLQGAGLLPGLRHRRKVS